MLLLAAVFERYRDECMQHYELDPAHYVSAPALTWDCGLKYTGAQLELLKDKNMYMFFEQAIRGGISTVTKRYARANNPHLNNFNKLCPISYIWYTGM